MVESSKTDFCDKVDAHMYTVYTVYTKHGIEKGFHNGP